MLRVRERLDVKRARGDLRYFASVVDQPLEQWQADSLRLDQFMTVLLAPRGAGKSTGLALLALHRAMRRRDFRVLIIAAGEEAAKRLLGTVRELATRSEVLRDSVLDESAHLLTLSNGSTIRCTSASERAVRGYRTDLLLVDEAGRVSDDLLIGAALPTLSARGDDARVVLADVAGIASGSFYDFASKGDAGGGDTRTVRWALSECSWITPSFVDRMRDSMSALRFAAEFECTFAGEADALFPKALLDRVVVDYAAPGLAGLIGPARVFAGVDWGATTDRTAICAVARVPEAGERRFAVVVAEAWPSGHPNVGPGGAIAEIASASAHYGRITAELNGLGAVATPELWRLLALRRRNAGGGYRRRPVLDVEAWEWERGAEGELALTAEARRRVQRQLHGPRWNEQGGDEFATERVSLSTTAAVKQAIYGGLRALVDREALLLPLSAGELYRELLHLKVELTASGGERIEARQGHDDLADALAFALGPVRSKVTGQWRTTVGDLATETASCPRPRGDVPDPPADGSLPREPWWQSVGGREVTPPRAARKGAVQVPREDPVVRARREHEGRLRMLAAAAAGRRDREVWR